MRPSLRPLLTLVAIFVAACGSSTPSITDSPGFPNADTTASADSSGDTASCAPVCTGKACGPDGCGGYCGSCPAGTACSPAGLCQKQATCTPSCTGKSCGPDGCNGFCGVCPAGKACNGAGQCSDGGTAGCLPKCDGKVCGDDGCGNACGKCAAGQQCVEGACTGDVSACGTVDDKGECQQEGSIAVTCKAGKLLAVVCDPAKGYVCGFSETKNKYDCIKSACTPTCAEKSCGTDGCGGQCGQCKPDETCNVDGQCDTGSSCSPQCAGKTCGPDGCGGQCGLCDAGQNCAQGTCVDPTTCEPNCVDKVCGPDGCGGTCGTCKPGESCLGAECKAVNCTPKCTGRTCGTDGCGGTCGSCDPAQFCDAQGHCVIAGGGQCGDLTYEGRCGAGGKLVEWCESGLPKQQDCTKLGASLVCAWVPTQETYWCVDACQAACAERECGPKPDGCSGECGTCPSGDTCNADGACVPAGGGGDCGTVTYIGECDGQTLKYCSSGALETVNCGQYGKACGWDTTNAWYECIAPDGCVPNCFTSFGNVKECGDDGCGNACGFCPTGSSCTDGTCTVGGDACGGLDVAGKCDAATLSFCIDGQVVTIDCAAQGLSCGPQNGGAYYDCIATQALTCDQLPAQGACTDSEELLQCVGTVVATTPCAGATPECQLRAAGYGCGAKPSGCATCPSGTRCQADGTCGCDGIDTLGQCEGSTLVYCIGTSLYTEDCASSGDVCTKSGDIFICAPN